MPLTATDDRAALSVAAALYRGLAEPSRLLLLRELAHGERRVVDLVAAVGLAQGTVSGHLACLRDCGLVTARPQARQMFYSLAHPELLDLFAVTETLLGRAGTTIALCPTYGCLDPAASSPDPALDHSTEHEAGAATREGRRG